MVQTALRYISKRSRRTFRTRYSGERDYVSIIINRNNYECSSKLTTSARVYYHGPHVVSVGRRCTYVCLENL